MIWLYAAAACLPWALLLPLLALGRREGAPLPRPPQGSWQRYLWMWALAPMLFFTASRNVIWTYILPGMPALAMLGAAWLARDANQARVMIGGMLFSLFCFGAALTVLQQRNGFRSAKLVVAAAGKLHVAPNALVFVGSGIYTPAFYSRGRAVQLRDAAQLGAVVSAAAADKAPRLVALYGSQWAELSPQLQGHLRREGRFGTYELYAVVP